LLDDDAVEVDDPIGWEPLIPAGIKHETVLLTAEPFLTLTRIRGPPRRLSVGQVLSFPVP
jgi:hypothetical protein